MRIIAACTLLICMTLSAASPARCGTVLQLATINWEPYTGKDLPDHGFFSDLVVSALNRTGYDVEFRYYPWTRALQNAKRGNVHGLMNAYWKKDRTGFLSYPDAVWQVKEEFIALKNHPVSYTGDAASLKGYTIGVLRGSAQAEELRSAGIRTAPITDQVQNVKRLLKKRIDAALVPRSIFFYHLERTAPEVPTKTIRILSPAFKIYNMYVAFSRNKPGYERLTADFNLGLKQIKADGTYDRILQKHGISVEALSEKPLTHPDTRR